jgi:hypothetical protein
MKTIILLFLTLFYANSQDLLHKYFKHLIFRETPYSKTEGRIPITKQESENENHYRLSYDSLNRLTLIEYRYADQLIHRARAGMMDGFRAVHGKTVIQYLDNTEIRTFYDTDGSQTQNSMNVYQEVYQYDKNNNRVSLAFYDKNNKPVNNTWNIAEYQWERYPDNTVFEKRKDKSGNYVTMRPYYKFLNTIYKFRENGMLISMHHVDDNKKPIDDESGVAIDEAKYDNHNNLVAFRFYDSNKNPVIGSFLKSGGGQIFYDQRGNCIKYATVDNKGNLMISSRSKAYDLFTFDKYGNLVERGPYGLENQLLEFRGVTKIKYIYNTENPVEQIRTELYHIK